MSPDVTPSGRRSAGDLQLLRCIGKGSHGEVWLGRTTTGGFRAVKIVRREAFADSRPFDREFEGLQHFEPISREHIGLMDILHIGRDNSQDCFYCISELADSLGTDPGHVINPDNYEPRTLHTQLRLQGRVPVDEVIQLGIALADAVGFLHSRNLVHRDLKPSNIIFCQGIPKLADVGLVTTRDSTRSYVGTTGYVPLEGPGTEFADIYALGKVLYQAATGMLAEEYPALPAGSSSWPDWSRFLELNSVIERACSPNASLRYKSAAEFKADLEELSQGHSLRQARRHRIHRNITAAGMVLLLLLVWLFLWAQKQAPTPIESFGNGLNTNRWVPFLTRSESRVETTKEGIEFVSRGGVDSRFPLPTDFEVTVQFRFLTQDDHLRICLRTDLKPHDRDWGRNGILVVINQTGEVMLTRPGGMLAVTETSGDGPFVPGTKIKFRIVCRANRYEVFKGDAVIPLVTGSSPYATGDSLTLYNRELSGMRLELQSLAIRDLSRE